MAAYNDRERANVCIDKYSEMVPPKPLGVFWDIENCNVPSGKSAMAVCDLIRKQQFCQGHQEVLFTGVCDATKESTAVLEELDKAQVDIIHVASNKKNAVVTWIMPQILSTSNKECACQLYFFTTLMLLNL